MTIPVERTRAVQKAYQFLRRLALKIDTKGVPSAIREEASQIMRHYPSDLDLYLLSKESDHFDHPDNTGMVVRELSPEEYVLKINARQAQVMSDALDFYSRIGIGQFEELVHRARHGDIKNRHGEWATPEQLNTAENLIKMVKKELLGLDSNSSYGITGELTSDSSKIAGEIHHVIRKRISWDRRGNPLKREWGSSDSMMGVSYDAPMQWSPEPLAKIERANRVELMSDLPDGYAVSRHSDMARSEQEWHLFDMSGKEAKWLASGESIESLMNWIEQNPKKA